MSDVTPFDYDTDTGEVWVGGSPVMTGAKMNAGTVSFSGDGSTTVFSIPHGMDSEPTAVSVQPRSSAAEASHHVSNVDGTNIDVTFATAPTSGTDNVVFGFDVRE